MRLFELLLETPQEDKVIIQLARVINSALSDSSKKKPQSMQKYISMLPINMQNEIGDYFNNIRIELKSSDEISSYLNDTGSNSMSQDYGNNRVVGLWHPDGGPDDSPESNTNSPSGSIILNKDSIGTTEFISTLAHELRHALDDAKSKMGAADSKRYNTPRKKAHHDDEYGYMAQPAEINARFIQAMESLSRAIPVIYKLPSEKIKPRIKQAINQAFSNNHISDLFPEKSESREYKQLIKRAVKFAEGEMAEFENTLTDQGRPKQATGNW